MKIGRASNASASTNTTLRMMMMMMTMMNRLAKRLKAILVSLAPYEVCSGKIGIRNS